MDKQKRDQELLDDASPGEKTTRFLSCELTDDEQRERGVQSANASNEVNRLIAEAKGVADEYKAKKIGAEAQHDALKNAVLQKREYHEVDCTEWHDYKKGKVYTVRDDLGLITESRQMTPDERQAVLPGEPWNRAEFADTAPETETANDATTTKKKTGKAARAATATA